MHVNNIFLLVENVIWLCYRNHTQIYSIGRISAQYCIIWSYNCYTIHQENDGIQPNTFRYNAVHNFARVLDMCE